MLVPSKWCAQVCISASALSLPQGGQTGGSRSKFRETSYEADAIIQAEMGVP